MKNIMKYLGLPVLAIALFGSCEDLDVPITTQLTPEVFPQNSTQFIQTAGPVYVAFRGDFSFSWWWTQSLTTDEAILPARGGNWFDNRNYLSMHFHDWTPDNSGAIWGWSSGVIGRSNQAISILEAAMPAGAEKSTLIAELKTMRAISYFMMMDNYGAVPLDTVYGDFSSRPKSTRTEVFNFIESELKKAIPNLNPAAGVTTYGRPNKQTANALLAKMYLNAQVYTGTQKNNECIAACDEVIKSGLYNIETMSAYLDMFKRTNGPQMKEFIFAVPYDPAVGGGGLMYHARYDVPRSMRLKFGLPFTPSAPRSTLPEFYAHFENDANDVRNKQWLTGLQYNNDGTPLMVTTTKKGYNEYYTGSDGGATISYHLELTKPILYRGSMANVKALDLGNDEIAWNIGYRNIKFYPDASSTSRNQNNDVPFLRYSDILLMKAEAILRGGAATLGDSPLSLVNEIRSKRTTSTPWTAVTLEDVYKERSREFAWEGWHRNDMIRFGKFEGQWGFKTEANIKYRVFPIPTSALILNPALVQNPDYVTN